MSNTESSNDFTTSPCPDDGEGEEIGDEEIEDVWEVATAERMRKRARSVEIENMGLRKLFVDTEEEEEGAEAASGDDPESDDFESLSINFWITPNSNTKHSVSWRDIDSEMRDFTNESDDRIETRCSSPPLRRNLSFHVFKSTEGDEGGVEGTVAEVVDCEGGVSFLSVSMGATAVEAAAGKVKGGVRDDCELCKTNVSTIWRQ
jgi:hypothetical protein